MRAMPGELWVGGHHNGYSIGQVTGVANCVGGVKLTSDRECQEPDVMLNVSPYVFGVVLTDERVCKGQLTVGNDYHVVLGVLLLDTVDIKAEELRRIMCAQIPTLPATFCLLTKEGWPVNRTQEHIILTSHIINENNIITIQKQFDRPRVGVLTTAGECIGFIFVDPNWSVRQVREALNDQLREVHKQTRLQYKFIERNGWPITVHQENILSVLDILRLGYHICIQYGDRLCPTPQLQLPQPTPVLPLLPTTAHSYPVQCPRDKTDSNWTEQRKRSWKIIKFESVRKKKDEHRPRLKGDLVAKPILISYVRAEASQHALDLKQELANLGFSVYLDVHEIKTGSDWQDALNYAVSHCQFFVPLITPMYGKTQWTNREVKLADVLNKIIIPINFLDQWPPECLAIQFASTQYIPWKPQEGDHARLDLDMKPTDSRLWDPTYIKRVCVEIAERCKAASKKESDNPVLPGWRKDTERSRKRAPPLMSVSTDQQQNAVMCESKETETRNPRLAQVTENKDGTKQLVVISAHPKQKVLIHELKTVFEAEGYDVWCSTDMLDAQTHLSDETFPSNPNTPRELPSIPEGNTVFGQAYYDIANSIADSKRAASLKMDSEFHMERRQLTRMISQVSDISQVSSLTPDKMERLRTFQQKTDQAGVVLIVVSEAYTKSKTSQQQVFYCEHRKQVVLVKFDQSPLPSWFTMLMGNDMIPNVHGTQFVSTLKARIKRALNPSSSETPKDATAEAKIQFLVNFMKKKLPQLETCVYIAGSSKLQTSRSEQISRAIGRELAKVKNIILCTGGFYGAPDIVAKTFFDTRDNNKETLAPGSSENHVVHLLPFKDSKDFSLKAHQNPDGSFEAAPFGKTMFLGDSVKERETAVARLFDTCIVIEGGPGAAHEVEEFIWNDHFVIPIISTGGAAGGQYGVPLKIFEAPPCVSEADWSVLAEKEATPDEVAKAVVNIVVALKLSIASHISSQATTSNETIKPKPKARSRSRKNKTVKEQDKNRPVIPEKKDEIVQTQGPEYKTSILRHHGHRPLERQDASYSVDSNYKSGSRWQRFLQIFSATKSR